MTHLLALATTSATTAIQTSEGAGGLFAGVLVFILVGFVFAIACTGFWIWMLVDAAKAPEHAWEAIGQNKTLWIVLAVVLGFIISLLHFFWLRPKLKAVANY